jgi:hypothetical protein
LELHFVSLMGARSCRRHISRIIAVIGGWVWGMGLVMIKEKHKESLDGSPIITESLITSSTRHDFAHC